MADELGTHLLDELRAGFRQLRKQAEGALDQVDDEGFYDASGGDSNPIAIQVKHMAGNLRSRWTDFLTSDGEKPDRGRESEFVLYLEDRDRAALMARWREGWDVLEATLDDLRPEDLLSEIKIRWQPHTVVQALERGYAHAAYHVGQIVQLARYYCKDEWRSLSVPRGGTAAFNEEMRRRYGGASS